MKGEKMRTAFSIFAVLLAAIGVCCAGTIQISNITAQLAATQIYPDSLITTITWTTDVSSTSQVQYGTTTSYGTTTPENMTLTTSHSVTISGLVETTTYHFRVLDTKSGYSDAISSDQTFTTLPAAVSTLQNGNFENPSLYPWTQYTTAITGPHAIDGIIGPYPQSGASAWAASSYIPGIKAYSGSYFVGAAANGTTPKNGGVFQRLWCTPGQLYILSAHYATFHLGGLDTDNQVRLGIDTSGGISPLSSNLNWNGQWSNFYSPLDDGQWYNGAVSATADSGGLVTVFLDIMQEWWLSWHVCALDDAVFSQPQPMKIGQLKSADGNLGASISGEIVTYVAQGRVSYHGQSYIKVYAQESDRSSGIAVLLPGYSPVPTLGNKISAVGRLVLINQEDAFVADSWTLDTNHYAVRPLALNQRAVGGFTANQPKLYGFGVACNVGLLVRVYGKVTSADMPGMPGFDSNAAIDDGLGLVNPATETGLSVFLPAKDDVGVNIGDYIAVTGILTVQMINPTGNPGSEYYIYQVVTRDPSQWMIMSAADPAMSDSVSESPGTCSANSGLASLLSLPSAGNILSALCAQQTDNQPGSISWTLSQPDGTLVSLTAEEVLDQSSDGLAVSFKEGFDPMPDAAVMVLQLDEPIQSGTLPSFSGMDISGTLITLPNGQRAIAHPTAVDIYTDASGKYMMPYPWKSPTRDCAAWQWKRRVAP